MEVKGAKIVIECLIEQGVKYIFGYPGGTIIDIFDELYKAADRITHILTSHEQGASHAADGYARVSGEVGCVLATSGPGATNLVTGIANAYMDNIPLVAITGNVAVPLLGRDSFQEIDITGVTMPITKHNFIVKDVKELASTIREAFYIAKEGCPGPVLVDIPKNIQQELFEFSPIKPAKPKVVPFDKSALGVKKAMEIIEAASSPLLYIGGGVITSGASEEVKRLSLANDIPISSSLMGLGSVEDSFCNYLGLIGMHGSLASAKALKNADTVIAIGTRFSDRVATNRLAFAKDKSVVHIDIDAAEIDKNVASSASIRGDAKEVLVFINSKIKARRREKWLKDCLMVMQDCPFKVVSSPLDPREVLRKLATLSTKDLVVCTDVGQHQMWTAQSYPFSKPRSFVSSGGLGAMGFGLGAAIGSSLASKNTAVLVTGDGSFHMNLNELATASKYNLPIKILLFNNQALGMVRQWQSLFYNHHHAGTKLDNLPTDYKKLAEAFSCKYHKLEKNADIDSVLKTALKEKGVSIIECTIEKEAKVFPMIPPGKSVNEVIE